MDYLVNNIRELLITSWRSDKTSGGPASIQGKYKTTFQFVSIILLLWPKVGVQIIPFTLLIK